MYRYLCLCGGMVACSHMFLRFEQGCHQRQQLLSTTLAAIEAGFDRAIDKVALKARVVTGWREVLGSAALDSTL